MKLGFVRNVVCAVLAVGWLSAGAVAKDPPGKTAAGAKHETASTATGEIVIAIRYLQAEGTSHAHLYLYAEDGRFLRQLTQDDKGQDRSPVFAPDGTVIVFTREISETVQEIWSVEPRGGKAKKLAAAPEWYSTERPSLFFTNLNPKNWPEGKTLPGNPTQVGEPQTSYKAPDGSVELVLTELKNDEDGVDGPGHGAAYLLRDLKSGKETKMGTVPGFEGLYELLHSWDDPERFFYFDGPLRLAFFGLHLNSMDGDTSYALDLTGPRLVRLTDNFATPFPLPGDGAFLTLTYVRYLSIPGSSKTANCSFVERWDSTFKKIRYGKDGTAPICYGASLFRPGKTPAVVTTTRD